MGRVAFKKGAQRNILNRIYAKTDLDWFTIARLCNVCDRTLRDWRREKYQMRYEALIKLCTSLKLSVPRKLKVLPEHWSVKKAGKIGAIRRYDIYGNPGTPEGRSKGGMVTQTFFRQNPNYAKKIKFNIRKDIICPKRSALLAEFIGIVLGDGSIANHQVTISLSSKTDFEYSKTIKKLIFKLFGFFPAIHMRNKNSLHVVASSTSLVDFLVKCGLKKGDKVNNQIDIPRWIMKNKKFKSACLRGLIDTDGGVYFHTHSTKGIKYRHIGLCFTSKSNNLLTSVYRIFLKSGILAKRNKKDHVSVYNRLEIKKYFDTIGSNNKKHIERFNSYRNSKP